MLFRSFNRLLPSPGGGKEAVKGLTFKLRFRSHASRANLEGFPGAVESVSAAKAGRHLVVEGEEEPSLRTFRAFALLGFALVLVCPAHELLLLLCVVLSEITADGFRQICQLSLLVAAMSH